MLYAAMVFWLLILVFAAYGTYQLLAGIIKPKILNFLLLPGTLMAQSGRMVGLLVTGGNQYPAVLARVGPAGSRPSLAALGFYPSSVVGGYWNLGVAVAGIGQADVNGLTFPGTLPLVDGGQRTNGGV